MEGNVKELKQLRSLVEQEILFASEAAAILEVSPQQLNQLVHTGKIAPLRTSASGNLYLRSEMEEEIVRMKGNPLQRLTHLFEKNEQKIVYEAINYFTIQAVYNFSDKKAKAIFHRLFKQRLMPEDITDHLPEISEELGIELKALVKAHKKVVQGFQMLGSNDYIVRKGGKHYPRSIMEVAEAPLFLFMRGNPGIAGERLVAILGTGSLSDQGKEEAATIVKTIGEQGYVPIAGFGSEEETAVHQSAVDSQQPSVAVLGAPITHHYPRQHQLRAHLEKHGLIISQFPPSMKVHRWHFVKRSAILAGLTTGVVLLETGERSDALQVADAAIDQKIPLFISQTALNDRELFWPGRYIGHSNVYAYYRVDDILRRLTANENKEMAY